VTDNASIMCKRLKMPMGEGFELPKRPSGYATVLLNTTLLILFLQGEK